ncbi:MAG: HAD-IC family P-type ATPase [Dehalococcoidia bacterium]
MASNEELNAELVANRAWHAMPVPETLEVLDSSEDGLSDEEASRRLETFGPNELPERAGENIAQVFIRQFKNPLIYVLLAAGAVSSVIGEWRDALFIFAVLLVNAGIGTFQEWKAETSAKALQEIVRVRATVLGNGNRREVDAGDLVPGDVVTLESGDSVPADIRLISSRDLRTDESVLTGESQPVEKDHAAVMDEGMPVGDRQNMLHTGTSVLGGRATGVVCRTADLTEMGQIAGSLTGEATKPPLVLRQEAFARRIAVVVLVLIALLGGLEFLRGSPLAEIFFLSIALAVAAIPEGLPISITVALSVASNRMAKRNVIVRLLPAVEGLGTCTLIASDKTGTLTANELTAKRIMLHDGSTFDVTGEGSDLAGEFLSEDQPVDDAQLERIRRLAVTGALCNEARLNKDDESEPASGDTVDIAFLVLAEKAGLAQQDIRNAHPQIGTIPFESERKFAATFNRHNGQVLAHVKGAAETVAQMCGGINRESVEEQANRLAKEGYRVIALAAGEVQEGAANESDEDALTGLDFLGLVGLIDPVRSEVPGAVERCRSAGVEVRMITGDHPATALAIAHQIGITASEEQIMTGRELTSLESDQEALAARIRDARVLARVEPRQKTTVVNALQNAGHLVAVTGDGVNDAPALRTANIGVAMGKSGTDVAQGAADLILTDDNFASIVNGIEEGRVAYDNVRKVTWLLISTGAAEIVLFFLATAFGQPLPLTAIQVLWLNLVTNGLPDKALALEKGEPGVLKRPPRPPDQPIFDRLMIEETVLSGAWMGAVAFAAFYWLHQEMGWGEFEARNMTLLLMVFFENIHAFNCRSEIRSVLQIPLTANPWLAVSVVAVQAVHIGSMYIPGINEVLEVEPVSIQHWLALLPVALSLLVVVELYKWLRVRKMEAASQPAIRQA